MPRSDTLLSRLALCLLATCVLGCEERPAPRGPDVVVQEFLRGLRSAHGHPEAGAKVVELLWKPARDNLAERAARASALSGRELAPGEMIAPSWLSLALLPDQFEWRRDGDWAEVRVSSADGRSTSARCALEGGDWKVALELPALPPIRQRPEEPELSSLRKRDVHRAGAATNADVPKTSVAGDRRDVGVDRAP